MATFLLAWNPKRWLWNNISEMSTNVKIGKTVSDRWSCGISKRPKKGDRFFMIRLGVEPKGLFASGKITEGAFESLHWDRQKESMGITTNYVRIQYDTLLDPDIDPIFPRELLLTPPLSNMHWDTQSSGVQIPESIVDEIEKLWERFNSSVEFYFPEEVSEGDALFEGAIHRVSVNAYERNNEARKKCIEFYGSSCFFCGFNFERTYGKIGVDFIHVHHLKQISEIGETYQIDPVRDLRPVCPNCHAILHRQKPPFSIKELKVFIQKNK